MVSDPWTPRERAVCWVCAPRTSSAIHQIVMSLILVVSSNLHPQKSSDPDSSISILQFPHSQAECLGHFSPCHPCQPIVNHQLPGHRGTETRDPQPTSSLVCEACQVDQSFFVTGWPDHAEDAEAQQSGQSECVYKDGRVPPLPCRKDLAKGRGHGRCQLPLGRSVRHRTGCRGGLTHHIPPFVVIELLRGTESNCLHHLASLPFQERGSPSLGCLVQRRNPSRARLAWGRHEVPVRIIVALVCLGQHRCFSIRCFCCRLCSSFDFKHANGC
mmetsp:Transcript_31152/g.48794  ORF Transcript_31152/g.48794 Transcript_31152/m.48794 type:complete len:272 (+) Transcript_31152:2309-3124(+)